MLQKNVREFLAQIGVNIDLLCDDTDLIESSVLDSLGLIALISIMEDNLKISFDAEDYDINNFRTITKLNDLLRKYE